MVRLRDISIWRDLTLPSQFLLAGAVVITLGMAIVGQWTARRIEAEVVRNSAISAALFVDSYISPVTQELSETHTLSPPARQALTEIFTNSALSERIVSFKIWSTDGSILHASDEAMIGQSFPLGVDLKEALAGDVASSFEELDDLESESEAALGVPLLEVYSPVRAAWTGEVIAVAEFYERADNLANALGSSRRNSWLLVGSVFLGSGVILFGIVQAGGRTIRLQRQQLTRELERTLEISRQNSELRQRVVAASARATAQAERTIRRVGSDLHDGPGQYLSLATLRLDAALSNENRSIEDAKSVREALNKALEELRIISRGLALPDLDGLSLDALIHRALRDAERQTGLKLSLVLPDRVSPELDYARKLCVFRFLQEAISNVARHAQTDAARISLRLDKDEVVIGVEDSGRGFDVGAGPVLREDGGQGVIGLRDRAESLGGRVEITSRLSSGTRITLFLPVEGTT